MCIFMCIYKWQTKERERRRERNLPTNVNFPPVMSKMIKMTDILLLINLRRTAGGREQKENGAKQKLIDHMHLSWVTALEQKKTYNRAKNKYINNTRTNKGFGVWGLGEGCRGSWCSKPFTVHFKGQNH